MKPLPWLATPFIGLAGGSLAWWVGWPLPWLVGGLLAVLLTRCAGWLIEEVPFGRKLGQLLVAAGMGLHFTPAVWAAITEHLGVMIFCSAVTLLFTALGWFIFRRSGEDAATAFFSSMPGGAVEMIALAERHGAAAVDRVAAAQSLRILVVVLCVPALFSLLGSGEPVVPVVWPVDWSWLLPLLAIAFVLSALFSRWRLPIPWMLGPLLVFSLATLSLDLQMSLPVGWIDFGMWLIGCSIGSRFDRPFFRRAPAFLCRVLVFTGLTLLGSALVAWLVVWVVDLPWVAVTLGMMPGGIGEMSLTAEALDQPVALVLAMQLLRFLLVVLLADGLFRLLDRLRSGPAGS